VGTVTRPLRFEHHRWLGDKRTQIVHDLDHTVAGCRLDELVTSGQFASFGPDRLAEARNRGYRAHRGCAPAGAAGPGVAGRGAGAFADG
jgi:hypothetical protein